MTPPRKRPQAKEATPDRILVVDDQPPVRQLLSAILAARGHQVVALASGEEALKTLSTDSDFSAAILDLDYGPGHTHGLDVLRELQAGGCGVPIIVLTGEGSISSAVEAIKAGAVDYLEKDAYLEDSLDISMGKVQRLLQAIEENRRLSAEYDQLKRQAALLEEQVGRNYNIVGTSPAMAEALKRVERVARVPRPVLIRGERGTGKELFAHAVHRASDRAEGPFVVVNCAAIPEGLLECELFGQEEDAYNNAPFKLGRFDLAAGGSLILDEIGNMGYEFQQKILRVIEYKTFERVQGTDTITADVRIIAATNADLEVAMQSGGFRSDLYDRLAFDTIVLPPLRERPEDIEPLSEHFIARFEEEVAGLSAERVSPDGIQLLQGHNWPGNVRELKNVIERAAYQVDSKVIEADDLDFASPSSQATPPPAEADLAAEGDDTSSPLPDRIAAYERRVALDALERTGWNQRKAADLLQVNYDQFRHVYRKHDLGQSRPGG